VIERRLIPIADLELPCIEVTGALDGPRLCLIAGIHGCEYSSVAAVRHFARGLDPERLAGSVTAVPIVNLPSFWARSPFVTPADGKNLNRCFPGSSEGTYSEVLAHEVFERLIAPSDYLVDLHGGDMVEALEPFALYDASPVEDTAREMAMAFGFPYVVRLERLGAPVSGTTSAAAAAAGIPAVIAEAGGRGLLEEAAVDLFVRGLENVLRRLGMLDGEPAASPPGMRSVARFVWLRSRAAGWWEPAVRAGSEVGTGALLGTVSDLYGDTIEEVHAPESGVLLFVTTSPAVDADGLLLGLGAGVEPVQPG